MIIDIDHFIQKRRPEWDELEQLLGRLDRDVRERLNLEQTKRLYFLYERVSSDLVRLGTFSNTPETCLYLEDLVSRAYSEMHESRRLNPFSSVWSWFFKIFPQTFRRNIHAFYLIAVVCFLGSILGGFAVATDSEAKRIIMPFSHLLGSPSERVAEEEAATGDEMDGHKISFSAELMTHNTRVSIMTMALGLTYGIGTLILVFYNGIILGAVAIDYILDGQIVFLIGWLLPHGSVEIPAILIAGQAGLVLAKHLFFPQDRLSFRERMRRGRNDVATLIGGVAILLVWAGIVESFFSQYHEPVLPYSFKILVGVIELGLLASFLCFCGRERETIEKAGEFHE